MIIDLKNKFLFIAIILFAFALIPLETRAVWSCPSWSCVSGCSNSQCGSNTTKYCSETGTSACSQTDYYYCYSQTIRGKCVTGNKCGTCTSGASCANCGVDSCSSSYQCSTTKQLQQYCYDRGCSNGSCFNNGYWKDVKDCSSLSTWTDNYRCTGNILERQYQYRSGCSGTDCAYSYYWANQQDCGTNGYCSSTSCLSCRAGETANCDLSRSNGCETNLMTNDNNCGSCGHLCGAGFSCRDGDCRDVVNPSISLSISDNDWTKNNLVWSWSASDSGSGLRVADTFAIFLDGAFKFYTTASSYAPTLSDGTHYVSVNAYDNANNAIGSGNVYGYLDKALPAVAITSPGAGSVQKGNFNVTATFSDANGSGLDSCFYRITDSQAGKNTGWVKLSCAASKFQVSVGPNGDCSTIGDDTCAVYAGAYDKAGNWAWTEGGRKFSVNWDTVPPNVSVTGAPSNWQNYDATAGIACSDSGSGCDYSKDSLRVFDSPPSQPCSAYSLLWSPPPITIPVPMDNKNRWVCAKIIDKAGNMGYSSVTEFKIDKANPDTPVIDTPDAGGVFGTDFSVFVSGDQDYSGSAPFTDPNGSGVDECYYYVYDSAVGQTRGWTNRTCNGSFTVTVGPGKDCRTSNGTCSVYVFNKDRAGNMSDHRVRTFDIQICNSNIVLSSISPTLTIAGETVTANVSISNCNGTTVKVTCATRISQCVINNGSCQATFSAPASGAGTGLKETFDVYAKVDKNLDGDFSDSGETSAPKILTTVVSAISCYSQGGCSWLVYKEVAPSPDNWVGMTGGSNGQIVSLLQSIITDSYIDASCNSGGVSCQVAGAPSANNGQSCHLVDSCEHAMRDTRAYSKEGKWDASQNKCVICKMGASAFFQNKVLMTPTQKCFDVGDGAACMSPAIWNNLGCEVASDNNICESACGASAACDERVPGAVWTEGITKYECNAFCQKVEVSPPISEIISPDPSSFSLWYSDDFTVSVYDSSDATQCSYQVFDIGKSTTNPTASGTRNCNGSIVISVPENCGTQGTNNTCWVKTKACKNGNICSIEDLRQNKNAYNRYGNSVDYNIDRTAPEIKH